MVTYGVMEKQKGRRFGGGRRKSLTNVALDKSSFDAIGIRSPPKSSNIHAKTIEKEAKNRRKNGREKVGMLTTATRSQND